MIVKTLLIFFGALLAVALQDAVLLLVVGANRDQELAHAYEQGRIDGARQGAPRRPPVRLVR